MGSDTFGTMISDVFNETSGNVSIPEIQQAINDALDVISDQTSWEFLLKQSNINTNAIYTTGTVSGTDQTTTLTLTGGTWDNVNWQYKWIYFGQSYAPFEIVQFTSPTTAILATPLNFGFNLVNSTYTIFQDIYQLPADCSYGRDLMILNTQYHTKLFKPYRSTAEGQSIYTRFWMNNFQTIYVDAGTDSATGIPLIKFFPIPSSPQIYPIIYYRQMPYLVNDTDTTVMPREFDRAIVLLAIGMVKLSKRMPGWTEAKMEGMKTIRDLRKIIRTSPAYDLYTMAKYWPYTTESSITDGLAIIGPIPPGTGSM